MTFSAPINTLVHGDCLKALPLMPNGSAKFVLTDPPYILNYKSRDGRRVPNDDNNEWLDPAFAEMFRVLSRDSFAVSFYGWHKADDFIKAYRKAGFRLVGHFAFPKRYTSSSRYVRYQHECAHLLAKGFPQEPEHLIGDVVDWMYSGNKLHPTQKPLSALIPLIEAFSKPGDLVLDPFAGSGSTLMAARLLNRRYAGIEIDERYYRIAADRLSAETGYIA